MVMKKRKHSVIPMIQFSNLIPNITDLDLDNPSIIDKETKETKEKRETYAKLMLLLFYPYRVQSDLLRDCSYWTCYTYAVTHNKLSEKGTQVMQNLQDVNYNSIKLKIASDELTTTATFPPHEDDKTLRKKPSGRLRNSIERYRSYIKCNE